MATPANDTKSSDDGRLWYPHHACSQGYPINLPDRSASDCVRWAYSGLAMAGETFIIFPQTTIQRGMVEAGALPQGHPRPGSCHSLGLTVEMRSLLLWAHFCAPGREKRKEASRKKGKRPPNSPRTVSPGHTWLQYVPVCCPKHRALSVRKTRTSFTNTNTSH